MFRVLPEVQVFAKMDSKIPASVEIEQPEIYVDYPGEEMESESLIPSYNIKWEPVCEADNVQSSMRENISDLQICEKTDNKMQASVKIEHPDVYIDYTDADMKIQPCPLSCPPLQEDSKMVKPSVFGNIDWKLVKHELSDVMCEGKSHKLGDMGGMTSCCSIQGKTGHNTESRISEDTTLIHHQEVTFIGTENGCMASQQHEYCSYLSEAATSMIEIDTKICLTDDNSQLHNVEIPIKQTGKSLDDAVDYMNCSPQRIHVEDTSCMSDNFDVTINIDTFLHRHKTADPGEKSHSYNVCAVSFTDADNLKYCTRTHTGNKPYICCDCGAKFLEIKRLKCHLRIHTGEKLYKCDDCAACFTKANNLKCHKRTHTGEKPYKCDICASSFTTAASLKRHKRTHTGEKPYKCDVCAAWFTQAGHLKRHKRTHKPYKCDVCAASFSTSGNLTRHKRTHRGEKSYKCDVCIASFTFANSLKRHKRTHTGEKPYMCDVCDASFTETGNLKRHKRTHTGDRPYMCDVCAASFTRTFSLKHHMIIHS